jgi:hypothetical protein
LAVQSWLGAGAGVTGLSSRKHGTEPVIGACISAVFGAMHQGRSTEA